jgi:site-specific recombinase XerC
MSELAVLPLAAEMTALVQRAEDFVRAAKAPATLRAYRSDWAHFEVWCQTHHLSALPAEPATVALYIADLAACRAAGTITRRLTSITKAHQSAGFDTPATTRHLAVSETLKGIRRTIGTAQKCKAPLLTKDLRKMVEQLPSGLIGVRDRALLLVGYAGGFRRSELHRRWSDHYLATFEDRPGRTRTQDRGSPGFESRYLSSTVASGVALNGGDQDWSALSRGIQARSGRELIAA